MTKEKNIDASKQENQSQDQFAAERLTDEELENVAGGADNPFPFPFSNQLENVAGGADFGRLVGVAGMAGGYVYVADEELKNVAGGAGKNREKAPLLPIEAHCH